MVRTELKRDSRRLVDDRPTRTAGCGQQVRRTVRGAAQVIQRTRMEQMIAGGNMLPQKNVGSVLHLTQLGGAFVELDFGDRPVRIRSRGREGDVALGGYLVGAQL